MKKIFVVCFAVALAISRAQAQAPAPADTWSNVPQASDDRYTNPKKPLYAGPNGWFNFGEVRAEIANPAKTRYDYKGGFQLTTHVFTAVGGETRLWVMSLDFGTGTPAPGTYEASAKPNAVQKKVQVAFGDVSGNKIRNWTSADKGGTVTVSGVNGFLYIRFRGVTLQPNGVNNTGDLKNAMTVGFEGAVKQD